MKKHLYLVTIACSLLLAACNSKTNNSVSGFAPIYASKDNMSIKSTKDLASVNNPGKIYLKGNTFYQIETDKGIHIIDVSNKANPQQIGFIQVPGAQEISIKNNNLYVNSINDLVWIDISNLDSVSEKSRLENTFNIVNLTTPPEPGYFECVDNNKGVVIGWEKKTLNNPKCRY